MEIQGQHILIVDDFKDNRDLYAHYLSRQGFRVSVASDGQEALDSARDLQPDLIVMDLSLPVLSGWEAVRRLKAGEATKHIPIVILTAYDLGSNAAAAAGCDGFLVKPCLPDKMVSEITRILKKPRKQRGTETPHSAQAPGAR